VKGDIRADDVLHHGGPFEDGCAVWLAVDLGMRADELETTSTRVAAKSLAKSARMAREAFGVSGRWWRIAAMCRSMST
jgi:hypothetical protein